MRNNIVIFKFIKRLNLEWIDPIIRLLLKFRSGNIKKKYIYYIIRCWSIFVDAFFYFSDLEEEKLW